VSIVQTSSLDMTVCISLRRRTRGFQKSSSGGPSTIIARVNSLVIEGGRPLSGEIVVAGNKNAALPMLAATLLTDDTVTLEGLPHIQDVATMQAALSHLGATISAEGPGRVRCRTTRLLHTTPPSESCKKMRASFVLAGPLLARGEHRAPRQRSLPDCAEQRTEPIPSPR